MAAPKGRPKPVGSGGSRKGIKNKIGSELKDMIHGALEDAGGRKYLLKQATENPQAFMALVGKILPKDINANIEGNMNITVITGVPDVEDS